MKKILILSCVLVASAFAAVSQNSAPNVRPFYNFSFVNSDDRMPDATVFLPDYPRSGDPLYTNDSLVYFRAKDVRGTPRGDTAIIDVKVDIASYMRRFSPALKLDLNEKDFPELAKLMNGTLQDIRGSISKAKEKYSRHRPYQVFNEGTPVPQEESPTDYTSYPSGHAVRGWALAMLFIALDPESQNESSKIGYELGQSRVIVGFHFQSDVEAARLAASVGFARLCAEPEFIKMLDKARAEIKKARCKQKK